MQFTINARTLDLVGTEIAHAMCDELSVGDRLKLRHLGGEGVEFAIAESKDLANIEVRRALLDDKVVVEINDEVLLKYVRVYVRCYKLVKPIIAMVQGLLEVVKGDCDEWAKFVFKRK